MFTFCQGGIVIFTTLSVSLLKRQSLKEKLHFVKSSKTTINEINLNGTLFYTSHIVSYKKSAAQKFAKKCSVPIITNEDKCVTDFKYLVTANTLFKIFENKHINIALFDKNCTIIHLLPLLVAKSRSVYVYTEKPQRYEAENNRLLSLLGAAAVISDIPLPPKNTDAIISTEACHSDGIAVFGEYGYFVSNAKPVFNNSGLLNLPEYADIYAVLTGLLNICKIKDIGNTYCDELYNRSIKNLP